MSVDLPCCLRRHRVASPDVGCPVVAVCCPEVRPHRFVIDDPGDPERPRESTTSFGPREASRVGMHVRSPARPLSGGIGHEPVTGTMFDRHNTQQLRSWCAIPATHASAHRIRAVYHW